MEIGEDEQEEREAAAVRAGIHGPPLARVLEPGFQVPLSRRTNGCHLMYWQVLAQPRAPVLGTKLASVAENRRCQAFMSYLDSRRAISAFT
jgi:hypothetical protein